MSVAEPLNWIENSRSALAHNLSQVRTLVGSDVAIAACVKGNAYGHGLTCLAPAFASNDNVNSLAIFMIEEAAQLRDQGVSKPIMCMGYVPESQLDLLWEFQVEPFIFDLEQASAISAKGVEKQQPARAHIKIDTGMTRLGVSLQDLPDFLEAATKLPGLQIIGLSTHFATSDEEGENPFLLEQLAAYRQALQLASNHGLTSLIQQASNSAAIVRYPDAHLDVVRPGRMIYGYLPDQKFLDRYAPNLQPLQQVIAVKSRIIQLKHVPAGTSVSYSRTYTTTSDSTIAVLPIGYSDGISRFLGNRADVLVQGKRCPIRGKICMNALMVDVSAIERIQVGDEVTLLGTEGDQSITTYEHGVLCNTLPYNVLTALQSYLPRVLVD